MNKAQTLRPMKISDVINVLEDTKKEYGDLNVMIFSEFSLKDKDLSYKDLKKFQVTDEIFDFFVDNNDLILIGSEIDVVSSSKQTFRGTWV